MMHDILTCDRDFARFLELVSLPRLSVTPESKKADRRVAVSATYDRVTAQLLAVIHTPVPEVIAPVREPVVRAPVVKVSKPLIFSRAQFQIAMNAMEKTTKVSK